MVKAAQRRKKRETTVWAVGTHDNGIEIFRPDKPVKKVYRGHPVWSVPFTVTSWRTPSGNPCRESLCAEGFRRALGFGIGIDCPVHLKITVLED